MSGGLPADCGPKVRGGRPNAAGRLGHLAAIASLVLAAGAFAAAARAGDGGSIIARARGASIAIYPRPGAARPTLHLQSPNADGVPLVFLVVARLPGWEKVLLPLRPNGSSGWVRDDAVTLALDPYRVAVSLGAHRIRVWRGTRLVDDETAGVGRTVLPTPHGTYYIVELLEQRDPSGLYGPYAFGLSAFSDVLYSFGGGPGEIGLHGTNDPAALGTSVSHGCIRISNSGITRLARLLPLGTPVRISA